MTWDRKDLPPEATPVDAAAPPPAATALLPRQRLLARFDEMAPPEPPMALRRALHDLGLIDEATWAAHKRLMTRGIPET